MVGTCFGRVLLQPPDPPDDQAAHRLGHPQLDPPGLDPPLAGPIRARRRRQTAVTSLRQGGGKKQKKKKKKEDALTRYSHKD